MGTRNLGRKTLAWAGVTLLALGLGGGTGAAAYHLVPRTPFARGVMIDARVLPAARYVGQWLEDRRALVRSRPVTLFAGEETRVTTYGELGIDVDVADTTARALAVAHTGSLADRVREGLRARRGEIDLPLSFRVDEARVRAVVEGLAPKVARAPVDAKLDVRGKRKVPDIEGRALNVEAGVAAIAALDFGSESGAVAELAVDPIRAKVTVDDLVDVDISKVLSSHETSYATYGVGVGRSANIKRAAELIDGTVIAPGATISFNDLVGPRTLSRGFTWAPEIQGDELTTGVGGGTCQVSTTLFIAAVFGALDLVEHRNHSHPSAYAKLGLDATVSYGQVDLKLRNPFSFPIMIHADIPKPGKLHIEVLGGDSPAEVTYSYGIGASEDFMRRVTVKSHLRAGTRMRKQKGSPGYDVTSLISIKWKSGTVEERRYYSHYRPAPEIFWVAPDYNQDELPPLPPRAKGVEGRLAENDVPATTEASF